MVCFTAIQFTCLEPIFEVPIVEQPIFSRVICNASAIVYLLSPFTLLDRMSDATLSHSVDNKIINMLMISKGKLLMAHHAPLLQFIFRQLL